MGGEELSYEFKLEKPKSLFEDCLGNMHIVCSNNVYQFVLYPDTMMIVSTISINEFKNVLKSCVAKFEDGIVMEKLSHHNQVYELSLHDVRDSQDVFFYQIDEVSARVAAESALFLASTNYEK